MRVVFNVLLLLCLLNAACLTILVHDVLKSPHGAPSHRDLLHDIGVVACLAGCGEVLEYIVELGVQLFKLLNFHGHYRLRL